MRINKVGDHAEMFGEQIINGLKIWINLKMRGMVIKYHSKHSKMKSCA